MFQWVQAITAGLALSANQFTPTRSTSKGLVGHGTLKWVETIRQAYDIPGISLGVIASPNRTGHHEWVTEAHGFGYMDEQGRPVGGDTLFAIASNSKLFVATSIGLLIENGTQLPNGNAFGYDTKIKDIYEDWSLVDPYMTEHLDVLDLLSMRSGLPRHDTSYPQEDPEKTISRLRYLKPSTEIRQVMQYNNYHYTVLAQIIPRLTGMAFIDYVQAHILDPLDMTSSTYNHTVAESTGRRAESYVRKGKDGRRCRQSWVKQNKLDRSCYGQPFATSWFTKGDGTYNAGPGGLVSSANDMMKWLKELLEPKVIPETVVQQTHTSFIPITGGRSEWDEVSVITYGQGQMMFNYRGHQVIQHGGDVPGFTSQVTRIPALGVGFFTAINDDDVGLALKAPIVYRILDDLLNLEPIDWEERLVTRAYKKEPSYTAIPKHPRTPPPPDQVIGTYHAAGYDSINVQNIDHLTAEQDILTPSALNAIKDAMKLSEGISEPTYIANLGKAFTDVMVFSHFDGPIFNTTALSINRGYKGKVIASVSEHNSAVFSGEQGFGMFDNFWGGAKGKRPVEKDVEKQCEVWFAKA